ncbi:glucose 1-dehydrogenase [Actinomadura rugatobispora]|uniref:Glucose 1-dehydrogenase n=1 Tax=Actinomadura rugatobispora TaxID=1994 RepID=A0ABW1A1Z4_9ACTN|nr:glucose 1-dehydrogenase [Actinomadura rugatobispora]
MQLDGKAAVVTGGASGIGAGVCERLVAEGARVVIADVDRERGQVLAGRLGEAAVFRTVDVTVEDDIVAAIDLAVETFGRLDVMVNNAGRVGVWSFLEDTATQAWDDAFALLARSAFIGTKHASRAMRRTGGGSIINTGSVAGIRAGYGPHQYGAAKAALLGLTRSAAVELAPYGITVNTVIPGGVATRIVGHGARLEGEALDASVAAVRESLAGFQPIPRAGEPEDLASAVVFLAGDGARFLTGQEIVVDGGLSAGRPWPEEIQVHARKAAVRQGLEPSSST